MAFPLRLGPKAFATPLRWHRKRIKTLVPTLYNTKSLPSSSTWNSLEISSFLNRLLRTGHSIGGARSCLSIRMTHSHIPLQWKPATIIQTYGHKTSSYAIISPSLFQSEIGDIICTNVCMCSGIAWENQTTTRTYTSENLKI